MDIMEARLMPDRLHGWTHVKVTGEVDMQTAPRLKEMLAKTIEGAGTTPTPLLVDLMDVAFMDSSGLGALISALKRTQEKDARLALLCPEGPVLKVLAITRLDLAFEVYASADTLPEP